MKEFSGAKLKQLRLGRGWTRDAMVIAAAERGISGISVGSLERWEQGVTDSPRIESLSALAAVLGVELDALLVDARQAVR